MDYETGHFFNFKIFELGRILLVVRITFENVVQSPTTIELN